MCPAGRAGRARVPFRHMVLAKGDDQVRVGDPGSRAIQAKGVPAPMMFRHDRNRRRKKSLDKRRARP